MIDFAVRARLAVRRNDGFATNRVSRERHRGSCLRFNLMLQGCAERMLGRRADARRAREFEGLLLPAAAPLAEYPARALPTFLFALDRAIRTDAPAATTVYTHNGKVYRLRTRSQIDSHSGEIALTCSISGQTEFKLWL